MNPPISKHLRGPVLQPGEVDTVGPVDIEPRRITFELPDGDDDLTDHAVPGGRASGPARHHPTTLTHSARSSTASAGSCSVHHEVPNGQVGGVMGRCPTTDGSLDQVRAGRGVVGFLEPPPAELAIGIPRRLQHGGAVDLPAATRITAIQTRRNLPHRHRRRRLNTPAPTVPRTGFRSRARRGAVSLTAAGGIRSGMSPEPPASEQHGSCLPFAVSDTVTVSPGLHGRHHQPASQGRRLMTQRAPFPAEPDPRPSTSPPADPVPHPGINAPTLV